MTTKTELQTKIQKLEDELVELNTIKNASVGDVLEDGSIVFQKSNGVALLVAPKSTEVEATWSKEFPDASQALKKQGFNPSQWFVPTKEQLQLAFRIIPNEFIPTYYWSSAEHDATFAYCVCHNYGGALYCGDKANANCVRAFRCAAY